MFKNKPLLLQDKKFRLLLLALAVVLPFEVLSFFSFHLPNWIEYPIFALLICIFGKNVLRNGFKSLIRLRFSDINLLMSIAILGAVYLQELEEAVIIVVLFALGEALEDFGINQSQNALKVLVDESPKQAQIKGQAKKTLIDQIIVGDIIIVKPGDKIPIDGMIVEGSSLVDESTITGEPLPKSKHLNDLVFAGTMNGTGYLEIKVTKLSKDSTLAKIIELTYSSSEKKSSYQRFIEKFATYYTPTILIIALLIVVFPVILLGQPFNQWFTQALTLLIISCPCALVISTPITVYSAIGNATRRGVLIKGGRFIEELGKVRVVAFDKTRTLTKGEPIISDIVPFNGFTKEDVLACAAGLELLSEHPLGQSIIKEAEKYQLTPHKFTKFKAIPGKGLTGECLVCSDSHYCMGNISFISEKHSLDKDALEHVKKFEKQGKTTIVISNNKVITGVIAITDEVRAESKITIKKLDLLHVESVILTGDNQASADFVAGQLGIKNAFASLLPEQKVSELSKLIKKYTHVAMVGDGVNDAPSLVTAPVGIAMGAVGSAVAIENADVAMMNDNLNLLPFLIRLGKKSTQTIKINTAVAVGVKISFLGLAFLGKGNLALAIFADVGVTVLVIINGLRLFKFKESNI